MNWTRLISKLIPTRKSLWPTNCFHGYMSWAYLAQLRKRLCSAISVPKVTIFFFSPHISIPTPSDIWTAFYWFPFTLCKYCLLLCSRWQKFSSSQYSHLEFILRTWGTEGNERRIGLFSLHAPAADPTFLTLIQWLISESVIASVMTTEVQRQTMWASFTIPRDVMGKMFAWREIVTRKNRMFALTKMTATLLSLTRAIKSGCEIIIKLRKIQNSIKYFLPAAQLKSCWCMLFQ